MIRRREKDSPDDVSMPAMGQRVAFRSTRTERRGTVQYADQLQILVKWDDGGSSSLRVGRDGLLDIVDESTDSTAA